MVAAGAERPAAVFLTRAVPREEDAGDVGLAFRVVERAGEFVHGAGAERVPFLGAVEGDAERPDVRRAMVGDVAEVEALDWLPRRFVEDLGDHTRHGDGE